VGEGAVFPLQGITQLSPLRISCGNAIKIKTVVEIINSMFQLYSKRIEIFAIIDLVTHSIYTML